MPASPLPIERLDPPPDPAAFAARWLAPRPSEGTLPPVIVAGGSPVRWSPEELAALAGDAMVKIGVQRRGNVFGAAADGDAAYRIEPITLAEGLRRIQSADPDARYYIRRQHLEERLPALRERAGDLPWAPRPPEAAFIWISQAEIVSPLHMDTANNFFCQVHGRKRILLYSPNDFDRMYPHAVAEVSHHSLVDAEAPDLARFPRFSGATCYEAILEPGDLLHLPAYWWHHVRSLDVSISLSFLSAPDPWQQLAFHLARARSPVPVVVLSPPSRPGPRWDERESEGVRDDGEPA